MQVSPTFNALLLVEKGAARLLAGTTFSLILSTGWLLAALDHVTPVPPAAAAIREKTPGGAPLAAFELSEPSLLFYTERVPVARSWSSWAGICRKSNHLRRACARIRKNRFGNSG